MEQSTLQRKMRVAAYCRVVSSSDPVNGCAAQNAYYAQKISENPDWELAGIFTDDGITSADRKNRRAFNRMIAACKRGEIDLILTKSLSRFSRSIRDCLKIVRELRAIGVGVIFEKEDINTLRESDDLCLGILDAMAQAESEDLERRYGKCICTKYIIRTTG